MAKEEPDVESKGDAAATAGPVKSAEDSDPLAGEATRNTRQVLLAFTPYLWLPGRWDLHLRLIGALASMLASRAAGTASPLAFGLVVEALVRGESMSRLLCGERIQA